jgi:hypothetical protein
MHMSINSVEAYDMVVEYKIEGGAGEQSELCPYQPCTPATGGTFVTTANYSPEARRHLFVTIHRINPPSVHRFTSSHRSIRRRRSAMPQSRNAPPTKSVSTKTACATAFVFCFPALGQRAMQLPTHRLVGARIVMNQHPQSCR